MSYPVYAKFHTAPLVLRSGKRIDHFSYFAIVLCAALAFLSLTFGVPQPPAADAEGVFVVSGP